MFILLGECFAVPRLIPPNAIEGFVRRGCIKGVGIGRPSSRPGEREIAYTLLGWLLAASIGVHKH